MTPVFPYLIRRSEDGWRGELLLRLRNGKSAYVIHLSLEQSRILAVEMRGLASDHCPLHHLAVRVAEGLKAKISHIVVKREGQGDDVIGILRLVSASGMHGIHVDAAAGLAMAIHMGLPIFMDGEFSPVEPESIRHTHSVHAFMTQVESDAELLNGESEAFPDVSTPLPRAFQDLIDGLELPDAREDDEGQ